MILVGRHPFRKRTLYPVELWGHLYSNLLHLSWYIFPIFTLCPESHLIFRANLGQTAFRSKISNSLTWDNHIPSTPFNQTNQTLKIRTAEGVLRGISAHQGGAVSSTTGQIKKVKEELQKLRREYLRHAADPQEAARLEVMIRNRKRLLSELGAEHG